MEYAKAITEASRRLADLITNILKAQQAGKPADLLAGGDLRSGEQLCECLLSFEEAWEKKELQIETDVQEAVLVTPTRQLLSLVWNNLFSNAVKFTEPHGKISLSLRTQGDFAVVQVSDTGCGIPPEVGKHIFEKFYQGDTSTPPRATALGLRWSSG